MIPPQKLLIKQWNFYECGLAWLPMYVSMHGGVYLYMDILTLWKLSVQIDNIF